MKAQRKKDLRRSSLAAIGALFLIGGVNLALGGELMDPGAEAQLATLFDAQNPSFLADIRPVFQARCAHCHGPTRPHKEDFTDYQTVVSMKEQIYNTVVTRKSMPIGMRLPPETVALIDRWIQAGMPEGVNPAHLIP